MPPVNRVEQLPLAYRADRGVGWDRLTAVRVGHAWQNDELIARRRGDRQSGEAFDPRQWWSLGLECSEKILDSAGGALYYELDVSGGISYPAAEAVPMRQPVNERPEPDSLHHAGYLHPQRSGIATEGLG
jgi:hypothetical protein